MLAIIFTWAYGSASARTTPRCAPCCRARSPRRASRSEQPRTVARPSGCSRVNAPELAVLGPAPCRWPRRLPGAARRRGLGRREPRRRALPAPTAGPVRAATLFVVFAALPLSCGHAKPGRPLSLAARAAGGVLSHVVTIVMEIKGVRPDHRRTRRRLREPPARRYGLATASYGFRHPLLPNYLALTSGSTHGIDSDCTSCRVSAHNVVDQLEVAGISWKAYMEDMPRPCFGSAGAGGTPRAQFLRHYDDVAENAERCQKV